MKKHLLKSFTIMAMACGSYAQAFADKAPFIMKTGMEYYVVSISPNGKWACGVYNDYGSSNYGFRWNLETDEIEMLDTSHNTYAYSISDDGIVAGTYKDYTYNANGAGIEMAGYWKDGKWNRLEMPGNSVSSAGASSISPDGHYISGNVTVDNQIKGYVWKDGQIVCELKGMGSVVMPYGVSPDGQNATGFVWDNRMQRRAVIWNADGSYTRLNKNERTGTEGSKFTPDGKYILYHGGWNEEGTGVDAIYEVTTGKTITFPIYGTYCDISNNLTVVGKENERGGIWWKDGTFTYADEYLISKGVNLDAEGVLKGSGDMEEYYQIPNVHAINADGSIMEFNCYHTEGQKEDGTTPVNIFSMIAKFNAETSTGLAPLNVTAKQQSGVSSVIVSWKPNVLADGISGYNIYRDGAKVNSAPITTEAYADCDVPNGDHKYTVTAMYTNDESPKSDEAVVTVKDAELQKPNSVFAQQHSYNNAYLCWNKPYSNYGSLTYYDKETTEVETFGYGSSGTTIEVAVKFDETKLAAYKGKKIKAVGFTPLEAQGGWGINFYTYDAAGKLKQLYSQPVTQNLVYGEQNIVTLDTPVDIPTTGNLIVATEVKMTSPSNKVFSYQNGFGKNGYTDILRLKSEPDFYSFGDGMEQRMYMFRQTWDIEAIVASSDDDLSQDNVASYNIYDGDKLVANSTDMKYKMKNIEVGVHDFGISAVYANGKESEKSVATLDITPDDSQLPAVDEVTYKSNGSNSMSFRWNPVKSTDKVKVQYCIDEPSNIQQCTTPDGYNEFQCSVLYPKNIFKGREGYEIRSFRFLPTTDATFTAYVQKDEETIQEFEIENYNLYEWNEYTLPSPIKVSSNSSYRLIIDCYDFPSTACCVGIDDQTNLYGYSDCYRFTDGKSWRSLADSYIYGNWMMGLDIVNPNADDIEATGYDVNIDNVKQNTESLTATSFDYTFASADTKLHAITVDAYYPVKAESVKGGITRFRLDTSGITENAVQTIEIQKGDNEIIVKGDNVKSIKIFSASGENMASAKGNTVSINSLTAGTYVVKVTVNGKTITRKIVIKK